MKLREFLTVFEQSDRLRIVKNEKDVYTGFLALMAHAGNMEALMDAEVKRFRPTPEIRHTVKIEDLPEFKARLARIKKIMRRRAWVNGHRTGKARKRTWKRVRHH